MEFCQLQINYLDWKFQQAKEKVELLKEYDIPVWVMEPLRGGKLAVVGEEYEKELKGLRPKKECRRGRSAFCSRCRRLR